MYDPSSLNRPQGASHRSQGTMESAKYERQLCSRTPEPIGSAGCASREGCYPVGLYRPVGFGVRLHSCRLHTWLSTTTYPLECPRLRPTPATSFHHLSNPVKCHTLLRLCHLHNELTLKPDGHDLQICPLHKVGCLLNYKISGIHRLHLPAQ